MENKDSSCPLEWQCEIRNKAYNKIDYDFELSLRVKILDDSCKSQRVIKQKTDEILHTIWQNSLPFIMIGLDP